ncbi:erythromycin esterase family protein [Motilimonas pumila]|uniref:Erythromycin esterase family protein n=1 Tax=Motilimonas pumila TaxID=2303987 RepID=A0A418YBH9_9GAMM|nr:erythromycin esterase family protein [Motilimonas pumila]RJG41867.1 hypothetical protein D1Z90_15965 [Motilimonas pumila]
MKKILSVVSLAFILSSCGGGGGGQSNSVSDHSAELNYTVFQGTHITAGNEDILPIIDTLEGYDIVGLGEQSHQGGLANRLRGRIVKGLHQEGQLDLVAFEAGLYDGLVAWEKFLKQEQPLIEAITGPHANYMFMQRLSLDVQEVVDYIASQDQNTQPLILTGFDYRINGDPSCLPNPGEELPVMLQELKDYIDSKGMDVNEFSSIFSYAPEMACPWYYDRRFTRRAYDALVTDLEKLLIELEALALTESIPPYNPNQPRNFRLYASPWHQIVKSMRSYADKSLSDDDDHGMPLPGWNYTDEQSADNVIWLKEVWYKTQGQTVLWAHNIHVVNCCNSVSNKLNEQSNYDIYKLGIIHGGGMLAPYEHDPTQWEMGSFKVTTSGASINGQLLALGLPNAFIDLKTQNPDMLPFHSSSVLSYHGGPEQRGVMSDVMDGVVFIPEEEATISRF